MKNETKSTGWDDLWCALYAFAGFAFELVLVGLEGLIGTDPSSYTPVQNVLHLLITGTGWIFIGLLITWIGKKTTGEDILHEHGEGKVLPWKVIVLILVRIILSVLDWQGSKVLQEAEKLGIGLYLVQVFYYLCEAFLIVLVTVYGQKAGDRLTGKKHVPWGGLLLGVTWGLAHILSKGALEAGLITALQGLVFGFAYPIVRRDFRKTYLLTAFLFVI